MKSHLILLVFFLLSACSHSDRKALENPRTNESNGFPILQGATTDTSTELVILTPESWSGQFEIIENHTGQSLPYSPLTEDSRNFSKFKTIHFFVKDLSPLVTYELRVKDGKDKLLERRYFGTLDSAKPSLRFAVVSCMDDHLRNEQGPMWQSLLSKKPEAIFMIGDNVYTDFRGSEKLGKIVSPDILWDRYVETRQTLAIFRAPHLVPIFSVWDDHDFGANDGDRTYPYIAQSKGIQNAFFGTGNVDPGKIVLGPGVAKAVPLRGQLFIFTDDRSFRSPNQVPGICRRKSTHPFCVNRIVENKSMQTHFGFEQEQWIEKLSKSFKGPIWLISPDQWFGGYHPFESYEGNHPQSFKRFMTKLRKLNRTFSFISGDRHLSELMRIEPSILGYETYELTSSGIHAKVFPSNWLDFPNRRQIAGAAETLNYSIIESRVVDAQLSFQIEAWGPEEKELYQRTLKVK